MPAPPGSGESDGSGGSCVVAGKILPGGRKVVLSRATLDTFDFPDLGECASGFESRNFGFNRALVLLHDFVSTFAG